MPHARWSDPAESHEAAASVTDVTAKQRAVLDCLTGRQLTDHDLAERYEALRLERGWPEQSESGLRTRRSELVARDLVEKAGRGKLPSGRSAAIWRVSDSRDVGLRRQADTSGGGNESSSGGTTSSGPAALPMFEIEQEPEGPVNPYEWEAA